MSGKVKNQHYVPQLYLRRFSGYSTRINVWDVSKATILPRQLIKDYAALPYYYDASKEELIEALKEVTRLFPDLLDELENKDEQFVEQTFQRSETDIANVLREIETDNSALYKRKNQYKLIIFLHDLCYRNERFRNDIDSIVNRTEDYINVFEIEQNKRQVVEKNGKEIQLYQVLGIAPLLQTMTMLMERYNWFVGTVSSRLKLIISDNPAMDIFLGFNDICFPISGEKAIIFRVKDGEAPLISKDMPKENIVNLSEKSVLAYNCKQYANANGYMFGDKYTLDFMKNFFKNFK